jgi:hypothetical protein
MKVELKSHHKIVKEKEENFFVVAFKGVLAGSRDGRVEGGKYQHIQKLFCLSTKETNTFKDILHLC